MSVGPEWGLVVEVGLLAAPVAGDLDVLPGEPMLFEEHTADPHHGLSLTGGPGERVIRVQLELLEREREMIGLGEPQVGQPEEPDRLGAR